MQVLCKLDGKITANKWFLPLVWAADICARALSEGFIRPQTVRALIAEICSIREKLTGVMNHDWVSVPLVYTQVVTLAVYSYFTAALIGAQVESLSLSFKDPPSQVLLFSGSTRAVTRRTRPLTASP